MTDTSILLDRCCQIQFLNIQESFFEMFTKSSGAEVKGRKSSHLHRLKIVASLSVQIAAIAVFFYFGIYSLAKWRRIGDAGTRKGPGGQNLWKRTDKFLIVLKSIPWNVEGKLHSSCAKFLPIIFL